MEILVAYDGSTPAQKAVEHAARQYPDAELVLLRVVEAADGSLGAGIELLKESIRDTREETAADVSDDVADLLDPETVDYRIETAVGDPVKEIVAYAEDHDVDHVFVGNHGRQGVSRVLLGSVAEKVVRRAPMPVTVVR